MIAAPIGREATFDSNGGAVVSASGGDTTAAIHITVGDGSAPADPTPSSNHGTITGRSGTVATSQKITTGNVAYVKAVATDYDGNASDIASVQHARRLGPFHKDTSTRQVTGTTSETTLETITVPANVLGSNGTLTVEGRLAFGGTTSTRTVNLKWGGSTVYTKTVPATGISAIYFRLNICNANDTGGQRVFGKAIFTADPSLDQAAAIYSTATVDTTSDADFTVTGQLANSADNITLSVTLGSLQGTD